MLYLFLHAHASIYSSSVLETTSTRKVSRTMQLGGVVTTSTTHRTPSFVEVGPRRWQGADQRRQSWGRLDDLITGNAFVFPEFQSHVVARRIDEVVDVLQAVEDATHAGQWAFGFIAYDAAAGLDPALPLPSAHAEPGTGPALPLVWFGLTSAPPSSADLINRRSAYSSGPWTNRWTRADYTKAFSQVKHAIAEGRTFQCNLTTALTASFAGDPLSFYADLARAQSSRYCAYLEVDDHVIASASPELFFEWVGDTLRVKPMKGTTVRGRNRIHDQALLRELLNSPKERAENIMIVDLLRNDLAKIAAVGSVHVASLLSPEPYPTVWQLTSEITATPLPHTDLVAVLRAMFPCGSVTGAPKAETMHIIQDIEGRQRGIYCGALGWVAPPTESVRARFNVAIRTAHIDLSRHTCEYGVGSGVTWSSEAAAEYAELRAKRQILSRAQWAGQHRLAVRH